MSADPLDLRSPVQFLKGVGTQRAEILNRIGLRRVSDLLFYFPRDYQDMTETYWRHKKITRAYRIVPFADWRLAYLVFLH